MSNPIHHQRLVSLRAELKRRGLDGYIVAHTDEHDSEYTPAYAQRLAWLSGFDGSSGLIVVLDATAALFVDGRYTLQAQAQADGADYQFKSLHDDPAADWIAAHAPRGARIGYDPWLHTEGWIKAVADKLTSAGIELIAVDTNPIDAVWTDRPAPSQAPAEVYETTYAGEDSAAKRARLADKMAADVAVLTKLDSIAWLLNIRGTDVAHTPLVLAFALLHKDASVDLYIDPAKVTPQVAQHLGNAVRLYPKTAFVDGLKAQAGKTVLVDGKSAPVAVIQTLKAAGATVTSGQDPCVHPKAVKNAVELQGIRAAHVRDGAALTRFLAWLDHHAASGELDELTAAAKLREFRAATGQLRDLSFDTISGAGPNGAIVHYRATPATNRKLTPGELYLVDSGGQYLDGTTDVTRTVAIGANPPKDAQDAFTRVLKGHIAIATARFPKGTAGAQLDVLARLPLWQAGLNYDHGTGHGVGCYLSVHEGPHGISKAYSTVPLEPGMIVSNEPGYYKTGSYGIRIENLVVVTPSRVKGDREYYEFETLTLAPIDRRLILPDLLTAAERDWLNAYHARVRETLTPLVDAMTSTWLAEVTQPI